MKRTQLIFLVAAACCLGNPAGASEAGTSRAPAPAKPGKPPSRQESAPFQRPLQSQPSKPRPAPFSPELSLKESRALEAPAPIERRFLLELQRRTLGGLLPAFFSLPSPWPLLSPLASPQWGDGRQFLRRNPYDGHAEGFVLFSIRFGGISRKSAARKSQNSPSASGSPRQ